MRAPGAFSSFTAIANAVTQSSSSKGATVRCDHGPQSKGSSCGAGHGGLPAICLGCVGRDRLRLPHLLRSQSRHRPNRSRDEKQSCQTGPEQSNVTHSGDGSNSLDDEKSSGATTTAHLFDLCREAFYVDSLWLLAEKSKENRAIGRMSAAGECQRSDKSTVSSLIRSKVPLPSAPVGSTATIGPAVCELEGPIPILNNSKALTGTVTRVTLENLTAADRPSRSQRSWNRERAVQRLEHERIAFQTRRWQAHAETSVRKPHRLLRPIMPRCEES